MKFIRKKILNEGYFKTPDQAKATRAKDASLSSAEIIAGTYNNLYKMAKDKVIRKVFTDYFTNYDKIYDYENTWDNVAYSQYLGPFFDNQNCKDGPADAKEIPGFNESLRIDYVCDDNTKMITVTPKYSFRIPDGWLSPRMIGSVRTIDKKTYFNIKPSDYNYPVNKVNTDMIVSIQTHIGEELAKVNDNNMTMETMVMKELQKYQFKLDKVVFFDNMKNEDVELDMKVFYSDTISDPKARSEGFLVMIKALLEKFSFGCKHLMLTYEDMFGLANYSGTVYEPASKEIKRVLQNDIVFNEIGIDPRKLFEFFIKYHCISNPVVGGLEHAMKYYFGKYRTAGVSVYYRRYYKFVIENNQLTDIVTGSLAPTTSHPEYLRSSPDYKDFTPDESPITIELFGIEIIYSYDKEDHIKMRRFYSSIDSIYFTADEILEDKDCSENDEIVLGWFNDLGNYMVKIIKTSQSNES